ncbi:MAG TPA: ribosome rescue protein RqcH [Sulfolobales archaeon]|nr:ribosome rescue protein RqcH [Sulfolobales archaeon]
MSWLDLATWIRENRENIVGSYIDNIYGESSRLLLKIRGGGEPFYLSVAAGESIYITRRTGLIGHGEPSSVVMGFRKYLRESRIIDIYQKHCDRVVEARVIGANEYRVIIELIPRGVVSIVDLDGTIRFSNTTATMKDRVIKIGAKYSYPPTQISICSSDSRSLILNVKRGYDLVRGLIIGAGVPPDMAEETLYRLGLDKNIKPSSLADNEVEKILDEVRNFAERVIANPEPGIVIDASEKPQGFYPYEPKSLVAKGYVFKRTASFNEAIDVFYTYVDAYRVEEKPAEVIRIEKSIEKLRNQISSTEEELSILKKVLEYVDANYQQLEELFECARRNIANCAGETEVRARVKNNTVEIVLNNTRYSLNPRLSFMENYIELRKKISDLEKRISRGSNEISRLKEEIKKILAEKERDKTVRMIKSLMKQEWYERYHWLITSEGLLAIGGMNADQNEKIVRKYLRDNDIFIHADIQGGSAVILLVDREYSERSIQEAATLAACYSRAWTAGYGAIDVFYAKGSQVSKSPPPGEYLGKGAFMIYGERGWIRNIPLLLGIGVEVLEHGVPRIIIGPPELVSKRAASWSILAPGDRDRKEIAGRLKTIWLKSGGVRAETIEAIDLEELVKRIPGRSRIITDLEKAKPANRSDNLKE